MCIERPYEHSQAANWHVSKLCSRKQDVNGKFPVQLFEIHRPLPFDIGKIFRVGGDMANIRNEDVNDEEVNRAVDEMEGIVDVADEVGENEDEDDEEVKEELISSWIDNDDIIKTQEYI